MAIQYNGKAITAIHYNNRIVIAVYHRNRLVWLISNDDTTPSCYSNGYWVDEYPWLDNQSWNDNI